MFLQTDAVPFFRSKHWIGKLWLSSNICNNLLSTSHRHTRHSNRFRRENRLERKNWFFSLSDESDKSYEHEEWRGQRFAETLHSLPGWDRFLKRKRARTVMDGEKGENEDALTHCGKWWPFWCVVIVIKRCFRKKRQPFYFSNNSVRC